MDECQDGHPENLIMPLLLTAHPQQVSHSTAEHANKLTNLVNGIPRRQIMTLGKLKTTVAFTSINCHKRETDNKHQFLSNDEHKDFCLEGHGQNGSQDFRSYICYSKSA